MQINESEVGLSACNIGPRVISNSITSLYYTAANDANKSFLLLLRFEM